MDFISHCYFNQNYIYLSEYGSVYKIDLSFEEIDLSYENSRNEIKIEPLVSFESKVASICKISRFEIFAFLENGKFYKIDTISPSENNQKSIESENSDGLTELDCHLAKTITATSSINNCLVVISGNNETFTNKFMTQIMVHPGFVISPQHESQTLMVIKNFLECFKDKKGDYKDLIYCLSNQCYLLFVKKYLEKIIYKEGNNKKTNSLRESILDSLTTMLKVARTEVKLLIFAFYSNIVFEQNKQLMISVDEHREAKYKKGFQNTQEKQDIIAKNFLSLKVKMIKKYWLSIINSMQNIEAAVDRTFPRNQLIPNSPQIQNDYSRIEKWLKGDIEDFVCVYCNKQGEVELDFATLVVGCGSCGQMAGVDILTGEIVRGDELQWFCYCCGIMYPGNCSQISRGDGEVDSVCFLCYNNLSVLKDIGIGFGIDELIF